MSKLIREDKLVCVEVDENANHNKYYHIKQFEDFSLYMEWGRIDAGKQTKEEKFTSQYESDKFYDKKVKEKLRGKVNSETGKREPYTLAKVLGGTSGTPSSVKEISTLRVKDLAKKQIRTSSSVVEKLIDYLIQVNIHTITEGTGGNVRFDVDTGLFSTPLGVVTLDGIKEAKDTLDKLSPFVVSSNLDNNDYKSLLSQYLRLIPQKVPHRHVWKTLYTTQNDLQNQNNILDSLESSYNAVISNSTKDDKVPEKKEENIFNVELQVLEDPDVLKKIVTKYDSTKAGYHACSHLKIKRVYTVNIESVYKNFEEKGRPIGNIMELFHGTRSSNLLSILKKGLIIPSARDPHVTGAMFGPGLYASSQSSKATNYSYGYWGNGPKDNNCFVFLLDFAMGKYFTPNSPVRTTPPSGYNSYWAKPQVSGVQNHEMIVPTTHQANLKYLIELSS